jgi:hypothetical protein
MRRQSGRSLDGFLKEGTVMVDGKPHLLFNKASTSPEVIADFNRAIERVHVDSAIASSSHHPVKVESGCVLVQVYMPARCPVWVELGRSLEVRPPLYAVRP